MDIQHFEEYDEDGNLIDERTVEVPIHPLRLERRAAIQEYRNAVQAIMASSANAATKNFVQAQARLMKVIVEELRDDD